MKILITNLYLVDFCGSENWCYAVANELISRGHSVYVYSPTLGPFFDEFKKIGVEYADSGTFDLILDNHNVLDLIKVNGFVIHTCHGVIFEERPRPNVINVAVTNASATKWKLDKVIPNGIDLKRFCPKTAPRSQVEKVLSLCKSNTANAVLKEMCDFLDVELETTYGKSVFRIENKINDADIVVGVGRSLLDSMACGRPVVSFDDRWYYNTRMLGYGYITPDKFDKYMKDAWTGNAEQKTLSKLELAKAIFEQYNPDDGVVNRKFIEDNYSIVKTVDAYLGLYTNEGNIPAMELDNSAGYIMERLDYEPLNTSR